jgi:hypothetical protein
LNDLLRVAVVELAQGQPAVIAASAATSMAALSSPALAAPASLARNSSSVPVLRRQS